LPSLSPALNRWPPRFSVFGVAQLQYQFRPRMLRASSLALRLTNRSTGHFAACGNWASFHSHPIAAHRKMPVSSNVRQRQCKLCHQRYALPWLLWFPFIAMVALIQANPTTAGFCTGSEQLGKAAHLSSVLGTRSQACASLANQAVPSQMFATRSAAKCCTAVQS
jgi:hypothetical protein